MKIILVRIFLSLGSTAFSQTHPESDIRSARERSNRAIMQHNIKDFAESLSADFVMVRGSGVFVPSKEAYVKLFQDDFADPRSIRYQRTPDAIEVSSAAPLAAEHGHWVGLNPNGTVAYRGAYLAMWRHEEQGWKIRSELFVLLACGEGAACGSYAGSQHQEKR